MLVLFIWAASTASPLIQVGEQLTSTQSANILPWDPVPSVLPGSLTKPQSHPDGTTLCIHHSFLQKEHKGVLFQVIEYPRYLARAIASCLIYTQTVTSFL